VQVADRFHLVKNLGEALLQVLTPHRTAIQRVAEAGSGGDASPTGEAVPPPSLGRHPVMVPSPRTDRARRARRLARYERVAALRTQGWTHAAIAREVGVSQRTIARWLAAGTFPERKPRRRPPNPFAPYAEYLTRRWGEGCHNATQLWREVCDQGYHGPRYRIWEVVHRLRDGEPAVPEAGDSVEYPAPQVHPLTPRRVVGMVLRRAEDRSASEQDVFIAVQRANPEVERACSLGSQFLTLLRERKLDDLASWLEEATTCGLTDLERFASGLERDREAVRAALTTPYSNGQSEGQITRLKLIKRSMYGRAKLDLLERRVLYRAAA
jgi:transposase